MMHSFQLRREQALRDLLSLWIPIILGFAGVATAFVPTNAFLIAGAAAGALCGAICLCVQVFLLRSVRLCWLLATGFLLGYEGGALNTSIGEMRIHSTLADMLGSPQTDLSSASALILWICAAFLVVGGLFEPPISVRFEKLTGSDQWVVWAGIALVVIAILHGDVSLQGTVKQGLRITPIGDLASALAATLPACTVLLIKTRRSRWGLWLYAAVLLGEFTLQIPMGRRVLMYGIVITCMAATMAGIRLSFGKKVAAGLAAVLLIVIGVEGFYTLRIMRWRTGESDSRLSFAEMERTIDYFRSGEDTSISSMLAGNIRDRTAIIGYFSDLLSATKHYKTLHGAVAWDSILLAVPSAFYPDKDFVVLGEEQIANPNFGMAVTDDANSLMTGGLIDFGVFGAIVYPLIIVVLFRITLWIIRAKLTEPAFAVALVAFATNIIQAEGSFAGSIALDRDVFLLALAIGAVRLWPGLRRRNLARRRNAGSLQALRSH